MTPDWHPERVVESIVRSSFLVFLLVATALRLWLERRWLGVVAQHILRQLCSCLRSHAQGDQLEDRVKQRCQELRLKRARVFVIFVNIRFLVKEVSWLLGAVSGEPTVSVAELVLQHVTAVTTLLVSLFPGIITSKTIHVFFSVNMCCMTLTSLVSEPVPPLEALGPAFFWCLFDLLPWFNALWLTVYVAACMSKLWLIGGPVVYYDWCSAYINVLLAIVWIDYVNTAGIRLELLAQDSSNELRAVKRLLGTICDDVVELDQNLCLAHHSLRLSGILMHASGRSLQGIALQDFMPSVEDRQEFVLRLQSSSDVASADADVFHTKLRDSNGSSVAMELFSVPFRGPDNGKRHLLGMREFTDIHPLTPSPEQPPSQPMLSDPDPMAMRMLPDACPADVQRDTMSLSASDSSPNSSDDHGPKMETIDVAKKLTIAHTLMGWSIRESEGVCCPWHQLLAELRRVADKMLAGRCQPAFRPVSKWRCRHCGIAAEEYRDRTLKRCCLLCKDARKRPSQPKSRGAREVCAL